MSFVNPFYSYYDEDIGFKQKEEGGGGSRLRGRDLDYDVLGM